MVKRLLENQQKRKVQFPLSTQFFGGAAKLESCGAL